MKPQTRTKQIQNTKFVLNYLFNYIQEHGIYTKASNLRLVLKSFELDESNLPSSCTDTNCLKNVQK